MEKEYGRIIDYYLPEGMQAGSVSQSPIQINPEPDQLEKEVENTTFMKDLANEKFKVMLKRLNGVNSRLGYSNNGLGDSELGSKDLYNLLMEENPQLYFIGTSARGFDTYVYSRAGKLAPEEVAGMRTYFANRNGSVKNFEMTYIRDNQGIVQKIQDQTTH